jgi:hypothetical protein
MAFGFESIRHLVRVQVCPWKRERGARDNQSPRQSRKQARGYEFRKQRCNEKTLNIINEYTRFGWRCRKRHRHRLVQPAIRLRFGVKSSIELTYRVLSCWSCLFWTFLKMSNKYFVDFCLQASEMAVILSTDSHCCSWIIPAWKYLVRAHNPLDNVRLLNILHPKSLHLGLDRTMIYSLT